MDGEDDSSGLAMMGTDEMVIARFSKNQMRRSLGREVFFKPQLPIVNCNVHECNPELLGWSYPLHAMSTHIDVPTPIMTCLPWFALGAWKVTAAYSKPQCARM